MAFYYLQLLSAAAPVEDSERTGHFREGARESARRDGISASRLCGDAGACASLDERAAARNALDGAAEVEAACGTETTEAPRAGERGADAMPFAETGEPLRAFWQARFYDFNVYSQGKKREKLNYMHANPVIRGLVKHPRDWRWSSWGFYHGGVAGLVVIDLEE